jgi:iron(III) transport system ATP-binding protein
MTPVAISGIIKSYDGITKVLTGIDLEVGAGELFFLLGGSGCGKTTLLRLVAGFHAPDAGAIRFGGQDILGLPPERRDIGMVFQNYALWPHLSVAENVAFGLDVRGVPASERARRVDEALALVELTGYGERRIGALSGGQQQRVALARAIVVRPKVLLLDEPLSNLDARLRGEMRRTIRRVCKEAGVTALYVTHDQAEALSTADRIALMAAGRVEQVGTPRELYERPRTELVARFLGEANILSAAQAAVLVPTASGISCLRPERIRFATEGVPATVVEGSFQGDRAVWVVAAEGVGRLTVVESAPPDRRAGERVQVRVAAEDLVPLA